MAISREEAVGGLALVGGVALFSTIEIAGKIIGHRVDPILMTFIRFFVTSLVLLPLAVPSIRARDTRLGPSDYGFFCLNGLVGVAIAIPAFHVAILTLDKAASCAVIFSANPVFVVVLAHFINQEAWTRGKWAAVLLGVAGISLFALESGAPTASSLRGLGLMTLAAFMFALSICLARKRVKRYGAMLLMGASALAGSLMLLPVAWVRGAADGFEGVRDAWAAVAYVSVAGTALAYFLYYYGLRHVPAHEASMVFFLKPVLASVLAVVVLHETINLYMAGGTALIVGGLCLAVAGRRRAPSAPPPAGCGPQKV